MKIDASPLTPKPRDLKPTAAEAGGQRKVFRDLMVGGARKALASPPAAPRNTAGSAHRLSPAPNRIEQAEPAATPATDAGETASLAEAPAGPLAENPVSTDQATSWRAFGFGELGLFGLARDIKGQSTAPGQAAVSLQTADTIAWTATGALADRAAEGAAAVVSAKASEPMGLTAMPKSPTAPAKGSGATQSAASALVFGGEVVDETGQTAGPEFEAAPARPDAQAALRATLARLTDQGQPGLTLRLTEQDGRVRASLGGAELSEIEARRLREAFEATAAEFGLALSDLILNGARVAPGPSPLIGEA
ncbi:hypothetical protein [Caulobacter sp. DWR1-3-2b1]|uniref:hypothetical protein n=1 Tax=Caulobacter sp. DWR1-3-2b1 TaxID=2804670 RepID=UPI003CF79892